VTQAAPTILTDAERAPNTRSSAAGASARLAPTTLSLVVVAVALYVLPLAFDLPLTDPDEGLHAAIAAEMVARGDYAVPRLLGAPFLDKPILFFAAEAASIRLFGSTEFAARLPGQGFGFLGAATAGVLGRVVAGPHAGLVTACIYATLVFPLALNQAPVHDVALVPWMNLAMVCFLCAMAASGTRHLLAWCAGAGLWLGLAMLTKGLAGVALVGLPVAAVALIERRMSWQLVAGGAMSCAVAAALAVPWYLAVEQAEPGYLRYFFLERHLLGFTTTTQMHGQRAWWYYLPIVAGGSLPWILTGAWAIGTVLRSDPPLSGLRRVGLTWLAVDLLFLSVAGSKLATYVLPLFTGVALVTASAWLGESRDRHVPARGLAALITTENLATAALLAATCATVGWLQLVSVRMIDWAAAILVFVLWVTFAAFARQWPLRRSFGATMAGVSITLVVAYLTIFPAIAERSTARDLAAWFNARGALPPQLWIVDERVGSFLFYLDPSIRGTVTADRVAGVSLGKALIQGGGVAGTMVALPDTTRARLAARAMLDEIPAARAGRYWLYDAATLRRVQPRPR
jgi:4-amino-4-deoxy-L-arabinose transferase-like glycosyltransferase